MDELRYQLDLLKAMNQKLTSKERMYQLICDTTESAYLYYSFEKNEVTTMGKWSDFFDFIITDVKEMAQLFDVVEESFILPLRDVLFLEKSGEANASVEYMQKNKKVWLKFSTKVSYSNNQPCDKIIVIENITKQKSQHEELLYMAYYDSLTGLYNRNYFVSLLGEYVRKAKENNTVVSVLIIDIDDFRKVNDGLGLVMGDDLVHQFGSFLKELCDENIIICHLSSDVFCMAIYEPVGNRRVEHIHKIIQQRIKEPFYLVDGRCINITVSIGVAEFPEASTSALELINCAEIVMYKGKDMGKNTIQYFDAPILKEFLNSVEIENKLKEAVFDSNFLLYFQPQFHTGNTRLRGMEALIRWRDDDGHMIRPDIFIPIAEKNGTIIPIGNWVVEQSIKKYAKWRKQYGIPFIMSINISSVQCRKADFTDFLIEVIRKYDVRPDEIEVEITESVLIDDFTTVIEKLCQLRDFGVRISLDDFGTGFSSLAYLKKLPIDTLKIDKSFIDTVLTDSSTRIITESIINMVKALGCESIAEGVENEQQYKYLHAIGCDVIQGYYLGKPMPEATMESMLQEMMLGR